LVGKMQSGGLLGDELLQAVGPIPPLPALVGLGLEAMLFASLAGVAKLLVGVRRSC
jgi:hypothetical protein